VRTYRLAVVGGDGIGPEVTDAALLVLDAVEERFGFTTARTRLDWSAEGYVRGQRVTPRDIEAVRGGDAVLLGAIGHPDAPRGVPEMDIVFGLRRGLDLFVNLRPIVLYDERLCPLKGKGAADVDMVVIRENTEDVYGRPGRTDGAGTPELTGYGSPSRSPGRVVPAG
jgi:3-isopropylmalate dehydrogenase